MTPKRKILVLGAGGFVGKYLLSDLRNRFGHDAEITGTSHKGDGILPALDVTDEAAVSDILEQFQPTHIVNLAGIATPATANRNAERAWKVHAIAPERLGQAVLETVPECWLLHVGTAFVYGRSAIDTSPVDETALLQPMDLYGTTKASGDMAVGMLVEKGLRCVRLRPFNHTGRLQSTDFAIPQFAYQIAQIEAGLRDPVLRTGNLEDTRDFLDVRDVVAAYGQLIANTDQLTPGSVFNVASGIGWTMSSVLDALLAKSTASISVELDLERSKRSSLPKLIGCASALKTAIRWAPRYTLDETLDNVLDGFRSR